MLFLALLLLQLGTAEPLCPPGSLQKNQSFWLQMQKAVTVQEGLCVLVSCSFSYPKAGWKHSTPTYGSWYKTQKNFKPDAKDNDLVATNNPDKKAKVKNKLHFRLLGDPQSNNCSLSISEVQKDDSGTYYFHLEQGDENHSYKKLLTLTVTELTQTPDIHIQEPLQSGHLSHVTCSMPGACDWPTAPRITWAGAALRAAGSGLEPSTSEILLMPHPEDHGTHLSCRVTFPRAGVSSNRTVQLSVSYAPQNLTISISGAGDPAPVAQGKFSHLEVQKGQFLRLLCAADSHPPATLSWVLEDRVLSWSSPLGPRTLELQLPVVKPGDSGLYTCQAENRLGSQQGTLDLSVQLSWAGSSAQREAPAHLELVPVSIADPPEDLRVTVSQENRTVTEVIRNGTSFPVLEGQSLRLVCVTPSNPPARLSWTWGTQTLSPEWLSDAGVLALPRVQTEHGGEFTCHARSPLGSQNLSLSLSVHYPPRLLGPSCSWEAQALLCSCSSRAWPAPALHWRLGEGLLEGNSSNASLGVTSSSAGPWANSSLSLHEALSSDLRLSCEAQNAQGTQSATVLLLPGKPELRGVLLGTLGAAGGAALLSLCACLVFWLKTRRKKAASPTGTAQQDTPVDLGPVCGGPKDASWLDSPSYGPTPTEATLAMGEEPEPQELHYASLSFLEFEPREPKVQEARSRTEYSEIKICNGGLQEQPDVPGRETPGTIPRSAVLQVHRKWSSTEDAPPWCWAEQEPQFQSHHPTL
ncbi:sialic acid-binding Ig-like lectin 11 isoform X1 [Marmota monax]|uniref:sialic acid-binding Ig-like lectin 11 isoform X1 n=1 Tax=Marmota monax TaxID=9995 RepID=UPI0026EA4C27|nr:sialic acid-binding Ig-like lectin 11 isoform X1 [Marmota monax]